MRKLCEASAAHVPASPTCATQYVANLLSVKYVFSTSRISFRIKGFSRLSSPPWLSYMKCRSWSDCATDRSASDVYVLVSSCILESAYERLTTLFWPSSQS